MAQARAERRLTAILAADVAGYSRLMGADEEGMLERLKAVRRELGDPKIADRVLPPRRDPGTTQSEMERP
jgi:adenylate cyclase